MTKKPQNTKKPPQSRRPGSYTYAEIKTLKEMQKSCFNDFVIASKRDENLYSATRKWNETDKVTAHMTTLSAKTNAATGYATVTKLLKEIEKEKARPQRKLPPVLR